MPSRPWEITTSVWVMRITEAVLDAPQECDLAQRVEASVYARHLRDQGQQRPELDVVIDEGREAWERLWLANVGMVKVLATRYGRGQPDIVDDLVQEGWIALAHALMRFDWARGVRLSTHAWHWVKHHLVHVMQARSAWEQATTEDAVDIGIEVVEDDSVRGILGPLSALERRVLLARANGDRQVDVSLELGLSVSTVRRVEERATRRAREAWLARAG